MEKSTSGNAETNAATVSSTKKGNKIKERERERMEDTVGSNSQDIYVRCCYGAKWQNGKTGTAVISQTMFPNICHPRRREDVRKRSLHADLGEETL